MDASTRTQLPQPRDGRAELAALAVAIAGQVDERKSRLDDTYAWPDESSTDVERPRRRRWLLVGSAVALVAAPAVWWLLPDGSGAPHRTTDAAARSATVQHARPVTPAAALGAAAGHRLGKGGRPVSTFGCQAAYETDASVSPSVLPATGSAGREYRDYMQACLSGMS